MFVFRGKPEYSWKEKVAKLTPEEFAAWRAGCPSVQEHVKDQESIKNVWLADTVMDSDELTCWNSLGIEVSVSRVRGLGSNVESTSRDFAQTLYQISITDVGLLQIRDVDVLEDACTDMLRDYLKEGWRIIAVCPPNGTRRPTYILGHTDTGARKR